MPLRSQTVALLLPLLAGLVVSPRLSAAPAAQPVRGPDRAEQIARPTLDAWSAPYRGWHYHPGHVIPARPNIPGSESFYSTDVPCVYQLPGQPGKWFMSFIAFNGQGYNSFVAESTNLVRWTHPRLAMGFGPPNEFDHGGCVIGAFLYESYDIRAPRRRKPGARHWAADQSEAALRRGSRNEPP